MTDRLPDWPRLLTVDLAAAYVGQSQSGFLAAVGTLWPEALRIGRLRRWDRQSLDKAVDGLGGPLPPSHDAYMEALEGAEDDVGAA